MRPVDKTDNTFPKDEAQEWQTHHQQYEHVDSSSRGDSTHYKVQRTATSVGDAQEQLSRLKNRIRQSLPELPENGEVELFFRGFKTIDGILVQARDSLVAKNLEETHKYLSTARAMIAGAEDKLDRLLHH